MSMQTGPFAKTRFARKIALTAGAALIGLAGAAFAAAPDPIAHCRESSADKDARIACLEAAIADLTGGDALAEAESTAPARTAAAETQAPDADAPTGLGAEQVAARIERERPEDDESKEKKKEEETLTATVEDYAVAADKSYILFLDNGHVWRQTAKANARVRLYPGKDYTVTIKKGLLSGYRVTINEIHRTFIAERIK
ncbi:hypothetical protein [Hyphococcus luteus]|uniref:Secreted protein n=1 Tax=Hyphococcus luteus TaxID=2058213 RepID=A0A2S7K5Q1_9PROT|nr:hypothetical protein [Marinicaulis flavus]PQA87844.1 hypothetical protein CW354_05685 [Marinicaulis flavus]